MTYDSTDDTNKHIHQVRWQMKQVIEDLISRATKHDRSKLEPPEKEIFDEYTPKLKASTYGSDEYKQFLVEMKPALDHHYAVNDHHPEHFFDGVWDMNLVQIVEMLCDWKAATMRHENGDLRKSIQINAERFGYPETFQTMLINTAEYFKWI